LTQRTALTEVAPCVVGVGAHWTRVALGLSHGGGVGARLAGQTRGGVHHEGEVADRTRCTGIGVGIDVGAVVGTWRASNVGVTHTTSIVAVGHCTVQAREASRGEVRW